MPREAPVLEMPQSAADSAEEPTELGCASAFQSMDDPDLSPQVPLSIKPQLVHGFLKPCNRYLLRENSSSTLREAKAFELKRRF